jgi:hypothetical protein
MLPLAAGDAGAAGEEGELGALGDEGELGALGDEANDGVCPGLVSPSHSPLNRLRIPSDFFNNLIVDYIPIPGYF